MDTREELARYRAGTMRYVDLSSIAQEELKAGWQIQRCGWKPDLVFNASGVSMERSRQAVLSQVMKYVDVTTAPPIKARRDKENAYDKYAIVLELPRIYDDISGVWEGWEVVGFVPMGRCPSCERTLTGPQMKKTDHCPSCKTDLFTGTLDSNGDKCPLHPNTFFNRWMCELMDRDCVDFACDNIIVNADMPANKSSIGLRVAIKIKESKVDAINN